MRNSLLDVRRALSRSKRVARFLHHFRTGRGAAAAGNSAQFTAATSEYLSIADNASLSMSDIAFTLSGWFYLDDIGTTRPLINKHTLAGNQRGYLLGYTGGSGKFFGGVSDDGGVGIHQTTISHPLVAVANTWYFVTFWHDATANEIGIQVNTETELTAAWSTGVFDNTATFYLGTNGQLDAFHNGRMAMVGIWKNRVLGAADIVQLYNDGFGLRHGALDSGLLTSLESYWDLEEVSGNRADSEGANTLTDNNTVTQNNGPPLR
jgi:hypothetical protein